MKNNIKIVLTAIIFYYSSAICMQEPVIDLISAEGIIFSVTPNLALYSKTIASHIFMQQAETSPIQIPFRNIDTQSLFWIVTHLKYIEEGISHDKLLERIIANNSNFPDLNYPEMLNIVTFLRIRKLKEAVANYLVQRQVNKFYGNKLTIDAIKTYPLHLQGILHKYWHLCFNQKWLTKKECKDIPGFGIQFYETLELQLENDSLRASSCLIKKLTGINLLPQKIKTLKQLYLNYNLLRSIPPIIGFTQLEELEFSHNKITSIDATVFDLPKLKNLYLKSNHIHTISGVFNKTPALEEIDFERNNIQELTSKPFVELKNLCKLNLFRNPLDNPSKTDLANFEDYGKNPCRVVLLDL